MYEELKPGFQTGNLRLLRRIGAGGMGTVWLADHLTLRIRVAVKFVTDDLLVGDAVALERFAREAEILARLKSPHIVQVLDRAMTNTGVPYLVMELLDGETLSRHIGRAGPPCLAIARRVVEHVGKALTKAHALGVVHRDIKPDNIFLARSDDGLLCKVFDFGVAKEHREPRGDALTGSGAMVGTPSYMSPEQFADSGTLDEHVDLWSLAVVAYIVLTGSRPFTGTDLVELCRNVLLGNYVPPSRRAGARPDPTPDRVDAWFARAFAPKREDRFPNAQTMVQAFLEAFGDLGAEEPDLDAIEDAIPKSSLPGGREASPSPRASHVGPGPGDERAAQREAPSARASATKRSVERPRADVTTASGANDLEVDEEQTRVVSDGDAEVTVALGPRHVRRLVAGGGMVALAALGWLAVARTRESSGSSEPSRQEASVSSALAPTIPGSSAPRDAAPAFARVESSAVPDARATPTEAPSASPSASMSPPSAVSAPPARSARPAPSRPASRPRRRDLDYDHGF